MTIERPFLRRFSRVSTASGSVHSPVCHAVLVLVGGNSLSSLSAGDAHSNRQREDKEKSSNGHAGLGPAPVGVRLGIGAFKLGPGGYSYYNSSRPGGPRSHRHTLHAAPLTGRRAHTQRS